MPPALPLPLPPALPLPLPPALPLAVPPALPLPLPPALLLAVSPALLMPFVPEFAVAVALTLSPCGPLSAELCELPLLPRALAVVPTIVEPPTNPPETSANLIPVSGITFLTTASIDTDES